jgi:hypothetical protein
MVRPTEGRMVLTCVEFFEIWSGADDISCGASHPLRVQRRQRQRRTHNSRSRIQSIKRRCARLPNRRRLRQQYHLASLALVSFLW